MDRIFYQAASAMMLQQRKLETVSNNVANIKTAGYKPETVVTTSFTDVLAARLDEDGLYYSSTVIGNNAPLSIVDEVMQYFSQGDINETTRPFDFAISGDGYFNINDAEGNTYYTRNGEFMLDDEGYLAFYGYGRVQGMNGDIYLGTSDFKVNDRGIIYDAEGNELDSLRISWCDDINGMQHMENGMFTYTGDGEMYDFQTTVYQGALEGSTVDLSTEMTRMMTIQSRFTAMSSVFKTINQINASAASEIGKI